MIILFCYSKDENNIMQNNPVTVNNYMSMQAEISRLQQVNANLTAENKLFKNFNSLMLNKNITRQLSGHIEQPKLDFMKKLQFSTKTYRRLVFIFEFYAFKRRSTKFIENLM